MPPGRAAAEEGVRPDGPGHDPGAADRAPSPLGKPGGENHTQTGKKTERSSSGAEEFQSTQQSSKIIEHIFTVTLFCSFPHCLSWK